MKTFLELYISGLEIQISVFMWKEGRKGPWKFTVGILEVQQKEPHPGAQGVGTGHCRLEGGGTV